MSARGVRRALAGAGLVTAMGCAAAPRSGAPAYRTEPTVPEASSPKAETPALEQPAEGGATRAPGTSSDGDFDASKPSTPTTAPAAKRSADAAKEPPPPTAAPRAMSAAPAPVVPTAENVGEPTVGSAGSAPAKAPPTVPGSPSIQIAAAQANFEEANRQLGVAGSDCAKLCKALASMQRATERLCGLVATGSDADKRKCTDARAKVTAATAKVNATCGGCGS